MEKKLLVAGKCLYNRITGEKHRILYVDWNEDVTYVIQMNQKIAYPMGLSASLLLEEELEIREEGSLVIDESSATKKQKEELEQRWNLIKDFVLNEPECYQKKVRSTFVAKIARQEKCTVYRINQILYRYWGSGKRRNALLPETSRCGGRGKTKSGKVGRPRIYDVNRERYVITEEDIQNIQYAVNKTYNRNQKYSFSDGYNELLTMYKKEDKKTLQDSYPTKSQFMYRASQIIDVKKRMGDKIYNKDIKGHLGNSKNEARGPGDKYQVDATIGDIYLVSASDPNKIIGRPTVYFVIDVFSRAVAGFYVGLENASWEAARKALFNAFRDKVEYCKYYGIEIKEENWPCKGVPHAILADNGEFNSFKSDDLIMGLGVSLENAPPWRADMKGIVEQVINKFNLLTKSMLPGTVTKPVHTRGDEDYKKDARLTVYEYTQIMIHAVLLNNSMPLQRQPVTDQDYIEAGIQPIPNDIWKWGMENRTGGLTIKLELDLWLSLLPRAQAKITKQGIKYKNLFFTCDTAMKEKWFDLYGGRVSDDCILIIDPDNMASAHVVLPSGKLERVVRTSASMGTYFHWTEEDLDFFNFRERETKSKNTRVNDQKIQDYRDSVREIVEQANSRYASQKSRVSAKKQTGAQIRKNRADEKKIVEFPKAVTANMDDDMMKEEHPSAQESAQTSGKSSNPINKKLKRLMEEDE